MGLKKKALLMVSALVALCLTGCKKETKNIADNEPEPPVWTLTEDSVELGTSDFFTFDIDRDYTPLKERILTDENNKNYVENTEFKDVVNITYSGGKANVKCDASDVEVKTSGAHVVVKTAKRVNCLLTGKTTDGSLKIISDKNACITLNGVNLKNAHGPALSCLSKKECFIVTDSASVVSDDSLYVAAADSAKQKGCIFGEGKLVFSGTGALKIMAKGADAIHSDKSIFVRRGSVLDIESHGGDAMQAKHKIRIEGGMININSTSRGAHGLVADSLVEIAGGRTVIISHTPGSRNGKNSRGIKSDSLINITGGIVRVKESSLGGKGIRSGHKILIQNAIVDVLTFGLDDRATGSKNKGIKAMDEVYVNSARVRVRAEGGWTEALEGKKKVILENSLVELKSRDDAISVGDAGVADFEMRSGRLFAEAGMDAIDSNGTIHIKGGLAYTYSTGCGGRGFDCDFKEFLIDPNATLVGLGCITSPPTKGLLKHPACYVACHLSDPQLAITRAGSNENLLCLNRPRLRVNDRDYGVLLSLPEFAMDQTFDFCSTATATPKHTFHDLALGGNITGKTVKLSHKFSQMYSGLCGASAYESSSLGARPSTGAATTRTGQTSTQRKGQAATKGQQTATKGQSASQQQGTPQPAVPAPAAPAAPAGEQ